MKLWEALETVRRIYYQVKLRRAETVKQRAVAATKLAASLEKASLALDDATPLVLTEIFKIDLTATSVFIGQPSRLERQVALQARKLKQLAEKAKAAAQKLKTADDNDADDDGPVPLSALGILLMFGAFVFWDAAQVRPTCYVNRATGIYEGNYIRFASFLAYSVEEVGRDALGKTAAEAIHAALESRDVTSQS